MSKLTDSLKRVAEFADEDLTERIFALETELQGANETTVSKLCHTENIDFGLFYAATIIKDQVRQINTVVHAVGMLSLLPIILESGEIIESISIGAGSSGKNFDLETNIRIAEFEFTDWQGNDSARQTSLFEDFYHLAEFNTSKRRCLYLCDIDLSKKFLSSRRAISSVLNKSNKLSAFHKHVGTKFKLVNEYYEFRKETVELIRIYDLWNNNRDKL